MRDESYSDILIEHTSRIKYPPTMIRHLLDFSPIFHTDKITASLSIKPDWQPDGQKTFHLKTIDYFDFATGFSTDFAFGFSFSRSAASR
ncbi:MAG: hypothetical protein DWI24_05575, partial [Planctomycetota bacterium]